MMSLPARRDLTMRILRNKAMTMAMASESGQPIERWTAKQKVKASDVEMLKELEYENGRSGIPHLGWLPADQPS